jgi:salicylate hydroxylase
VTDVQKFALFAGPRLDSVASRGSIALIGDASHRKSSIPRSATFILTDPDSIVGRIR